MSDLGQVTGANSMEKVHVIQVILKKDDILFLILETCELNLGNAKPNTSGSQILLFCVTHKKKYLNALKQKLA